MGFIHDETENILWTPQTDDSRVSLQEIIPLIETTFTSQDEAKMINDLRGDEAQAFIDMLHKVRASALVHFLEAQSNCICPLWFLRFRTFTFH